MRVVATALALAVLGATAAVLATPARAGSSRSEPTAAAASPGGTPEVFAEFASAAGESGVRSVQLFLDGEDVTESSELSAIRVAHRPSEPLSPGEHAARVIVVDALGRSFEHAWTFTVEAANDGDEVVLFFSDDLLVELDPLPSRSRRPTLRVAGSSQPLVDVTVHVNGRLAGRDTTAASGRFHLDVDLEDGTNELEVAAVRWPAGESGPSVVRRVRFEALDVPTAEPAAREPEAVPVADGRVGRPAPPRHGPLEPGGPDAPGGDDPDVHEVPRASLGDRDEIVDKPDRRGQALETPDVVRITKPSAGDAIQADHVTVLGRAPAGWTVTVLVNGVVGGDDDANPAGHFTVPRVPLDAGESVLVARAESPDGQQAAESAPVTVVHDGGQDDPGPLALAELRLDRPAARASVVRGDVLDVSGTAWDGALVEVEVNGRVVATDGARQDGRFVLRVPLDAGPNHVIVEALDPTGERSVRSEVLLVTARSSVRRAGPVRRELAGGRAARGLGRERR